MVNPRPFKTVKGVMVTLSGGYGDSVMVKDAKVDKIAQKINASMKDGKLIELGGKWINPNGVSSVAAHEWQDYSR